MWWLPRGGFGPGGEEFIRYERRLLRVCGALARNLAAECNECVCCLISRMVSLLAVVLSMANVVSSVDLYEQVTPRHFASPKNLVSKDIINGFR